MEEEEEEEKKKQQTKSRICFGDILYGGHELMSLEQYALRIKVSAMGYSRQAEEWARGRHEWRE